MTSAADSRVMEEALRFKMDFVTRDARKGIREVKRLAKGLGKEAGAEIGKAEKKTREWGRSLKRASRISRQVGRDLRTMGSAFGGVAGAGGKALRVFGGLSTSIAAAGGAMGPAGVAAAAFALAATGGALAAVRLAQGLIEVSREGREMAESLSYLREVDSLVPVIGVDALNSYDETKASIDALSASGRVAALAFSQEFAPAIREVMTLGIAATLALANMSTEVNKSIESIVKGASGMALVLSGRLTEAMAVLSADGAQVASKGMEGLTAAFGSYAEEAKRIIDETLVFNEETRTAKDRQDALTESNRKAAEQARAQAEALAIQRNAVRDLMGPRGQLLFSYAEELEKLEALRKAGASDEQIAATQKALYDQLQAAQTRLDEQELEAIARKEEERQRAHEAQMQRIAAEEEAAKAAAMAEIRMATDLAGATSRLVAQTFQDKKAAQVAEGMTAALLAGINTIATNPTPAGIALAGINTALAMGQVAQMQGITAHRGRFHGDEYPITVRRGEAHLSNVGRQMMGDAAIEDANAGRRPQVGQVLEVRQFYRHRPYDEFARDNLARGGPLISAINDSRDGYGHMRGNRNGA